MSLAYDLGYSNFVKNAQLGFIGNIGNVLANSSILSDSTNNDLGRKIDSLMSRLPDEESEKSDDSPEKIRVVVEDEYAKKALGKKKRLIERLLSDLRKKRKI